MINYLRVTIVLLMLTCAACPAQKANFGTGPVPVPTCGPDGCFPTVN